MTNTGPSLLADPTTHPCGFCGNSSEMTQDTNTLRQYTCTSCSAVETITKGKTSWWYHGWKNKTNQRLRAPTSAEMERGVFGWQHNA